MATRHLDAKEQRKAARLLALIRLKLIGMSQSDPELLFAYRRKIYKELAYDERGKPSVRRKLKMLKWEEQGGRCALCRHKLPLRDSEMDRKKPMLGYTMKNITVVHHQCHRRQQEGRRFT
ncbi:MAG TPA: hypothetical protein VL305_00450 [Pseudolabrys sp.]|jgi:hypothetical protein|nr:hypothetical protein [Pseudolabrys sp.]